MFGFLKKLIMFLFWKHLSYEEGALAAMCRQLLGKMPTRIPIKPIGLQSSRHPGKSPPFSGAWKE